MKKASIFDMDGVVSDTQKQHAQVESVLLNRYGIKISPAEITARFSGVRTSKFFEELFREKGVSVDIDTLIKEKWERMIKLTENNIEAIPGAIRLINQLKEKKFKLGLASGSTTEFIKTVISKLDLKDKFSAITSSDEVKRGKPDPEIFLLTAQKLSVPPHRCIVIEDGISGMIAAKKAGMKCIGLVANDDNKDYPADKVVRSLEELTVEDINNLFLQRL